MLTDFPTKPIPHSGIVNRTPLPLPLGEVDERSEAGEGIPGCNALSVTFGDSSPRGRAKGLTDESGAAYAAPLITILVNFAADYSLGPASTRALPASLPSYLTKFLTNRPARSLALVSQSSTLA